MNENMNELWQARLHEGKMKIELKGAIAATNHGAPMHIEARARARWADAYCRVRELEGTTDHE